MEKRGTDATTRRRGGRAALVPLGLAAVVAAIAGRLLFASSRRRAAAVTAAGGGRPAGPAGPGAPLRWPGAPPCLSEAEGRARLAAAKSVGGFGPAGPEGRAALAAAGARLGAPEGELEKARTMTVALAARRAGARALREGPALRAALARGEPLARVAKERGLPPLAALRAALLEGGAPGAAVRRAVAAAAEGDAAGAAAAVPGAPPAVWGQVPAAAAADLGSRGHNERVRKASLAFEAAVARQLRAGGHAFLTEAEARAAAAAAGRPPPALTPDFLLSPPARAPGGEAVHWVDAKNFPHYAAGGPGSQKITEQAAKYCAAFGPGAFVFSGGLLCAGGVRPPGVVLLDGSALPGAAAALLL